jgi:fusion and transport protein UGO1
VKETRLCTTTERAAKTRVEKRVSHTPLLSPAHFQLLMDSQPAAPASHPLRPYSVSTKPEDWAWNPTDHTSSSAPHPPTGSSTPPSLRLPSTNRYESSVGDLDESPVSFPNAGTILRSFVTSSALSFVGVALVQPFEVGKTLAQVQWVPRDGLEPFLGYDMAELDEESVEVRPLVSLGSVR